MLTEFLRLSPCPPWWSQFHSPSISPLWCCFKPGASWNIHCLCLVLKAVQGSDVHSLLSLTYHIKNLVPFIHELSLQKKLNGLSSQGQMEGRTHVNRYYILFIYYPYRKKLSGLSGGGQTVVGDVGGGQYRMSASSRDGGDEYSSEASELDTRGSVSGRQMLFFFTICSTVLTFYLESATSSVMAIWFTLK